MPIRQTKQERAGVPLTATDADIVRNGIVLDAIERVETNEQGCITFDQSPCLLQGQEPRQDEAALRFANLAINAVSQGILITDPYLPDNPVVYASPSFERMTGYSAQEVVGRNCRFLQGPDTAPEAVALMRAAIQEKRGCSIELLNYRKDGVPFWNALNLAPVLDSNGHLTHFVGVQTDVTERRQMEEQFRHTQKIEVIGQMAAGIAHDFNNLLTVINGYSELVLDQLPLQDPLHEPIGRIKWAGGQAGALTHQLLAFSRQQVSAPIVLDLNSVVSDFEKILRRLIGEDIFLTTTLSPVPGAVKADPSQLIQILMNLTINARDAMPNGGRISIETQNVGLKAANCHGLVGDYVLLTVSDTGSGMDTATMSRIFEPFFTTKGPYKGTGLGLAIVRSVVKQAGGHISVCSNVGCGTTFNIYLPMVQTETAPTDKAPSAMEKMPTGSETLLLVEDDAVLRGLELHILRGCGYNVLEASEGREAIDIAETYEGSLDLLISDLGMPYMGGHKLSGWIASLRPECKVLLVSGHKATAIGDGVPEAEHAFLQKPFTPSALAHKVRNVLDGIA